VLGALGAVAISYSRTRDACVAQGGVLVVGFYSWTCVRPLELKP
jgi:hypothetical protein